MSNRLFVYTDMSYRPGLDLYGYAWVATTSNTVLSHFAGSKPCDPYPSLTVLEATPVLDALVTLGSREEDLVFLLDSRPAIDLLTGLLTSNDPNPLNDHPMVDVFVERYLNGTLRLRWTPGILVNGRSGGINRAAVVLGHKVVHKAARSRNMGVSSANRSVFEIWQNNAVHHYGLHKSSRAIKPFDDEFRDEWFGIGPVGERFDVLGSDREVLEALGADYLSETGIDRVMEELAEAGVAGAGNPFAHLGDDDFVILCQGGRVLGYIAGGVVSDGLELVSSIYVRPEYRGRGYGRRLFKALLEHQSVFDMKAYLALPLPQAVGFFRKLGFSEDGLSEKDVAEGRLAYRLESGGV